MHVREEVSSCRTGDALTARRICMWDGHVGSDDRIGRICRSGQNHPMRPAMCKSETETQNWRVREKPVVEAAVLSGVTVSDCDRQMISVLAIAVPMRVDAQIGNRNWRLRPKIVTWRTPNQRDANTHNWGSQTFSSWATEACEGVRALDQRDEELVDISRVRRVYWCRDPRQKTLDGLIPHGGAGRWD